MKNSRMSAIALLAALTTIGSVATSMAVDYSAVVKSFDPASYWRLGEKEGTTAVDAIRGRNATYRVGNVLGKTGAIVGDSDTAVQFPGLNPTDANNGIIVVTDGIEIGAVTEATFMCWAKRDGDQGTHTELVFNRAGQPTGQFASLPSGTGKTTGLTVVAGNSLGYHWNDGSNTYGYDSGLDLTDGAWNFCALSVTPTAAIFYLGDASGNLTSATNSVTHAETTLSSTFVIGGTVSSNKGRVFKGDIDEPAVFTHALTGEQIKTIYQAGLNKTAPATASIVPSVDPMYAGEGTLTGVPGGTPPLTYAWLKDGTIIEGETTTTLTGVLGAGSYTFRVTGSGTADGTFEVQAAKAPEITVQPTGAGDRYLGGRLNTSVEAVGSMPFAYQWKLNGKAIEGATNSSIAQILTTGMFGSYTVDVSNSLGTSTSDPVVLKQVQYTADSFTQAVMEQNPIAFFRFDDVIDENTATQDDEGNLITGMANDYAGGNVGYYYNVYSYDQIDGAIKDDPSKAIHFDGGSSYLGTRLQLNGLTKSGFTTMGWVKRDSDYGAFTIRGGYFGQNDLNEFGDSFETAGTVTNATLIECWCADGLQIKVKHNFVDKEWSLVTLTYDGSLLTLYLDGQAMGTSTGTLNAKAGTDYYFNVGGGGIFNDPDVNGDFFLGDIDEIAMFDQCMTADAVQEFYFKGHYGPGAAPDIRKQPVSVESYENPEVSWTISVVSGGTSPLSFQWFKNGTAITDATGTSITGFFTDEYVGSYTVTVSNNYGTVTSDAATVTVRHPDPESYEGILAALEPYAYWRFGEKTGTVATEFIGGYNGTYNSAQTLGQTGALKGDSDTAVAFDKTSYVAVSGLSLSTDTMTMLCWLKPNIEHSNYNGLMFDRGSSAVGIDIADNQVCYHWNDTQWSYRSGLYPVTNAWNFIVMVVTPTKATFYLGDANGRLTSAVNTTTHAAATLTSSFSIGGDTVNTERRIDGTIDEPAIFTRALTAEEIEKLYTVALSGLNSPPSITVQPENLTVFVEDAASLSVAALGSSPLSYQWYKDDAILEGATESTITWDSAQVVDSGVYYVEVTNPYGKATSNKATFEVRYTPYSIDLTGEEYKLWTHLKFEDNMEDSSANGNYANDFSWSGGCSYDTGMLGKSVFFKTELDESTNMLTCDYAQFADKSLYIHTEPLTVSFWTKMVTAAAPNVPWLSNSTYSDSDKDGVTIAPRNGTEGQEVSTFSFTDTTGITYYVDGGVTSGQWHHLVYVIIPNDRVKFFLDGEYLGAGNISGVTVVAEDEEKGSLDSTLPFTLGQSGGVNVNKAIEMYMDDLGIWKSALSNIEVRSIYYAGKAGNSFDADIPDTRKPEITLQPVGATVYQNDATELTFTVEATGKQPLTYVWTKGGAEVGTGASLTVNCTAEAAGSYTVTVTNDNGKVTSTPAVLAYCEPEEGYATAVVELNPYAFWRFDDTITGDVAYEYVRGLNGTYVDVTPAQQVAGAIIDDPSLAIQFLGTNSTSYIDTPLQLNDLIKDGAFTVMGWVKRDTYLGKEGYFGQNDLVEFGQTAATAASAWSPGPGTIAGSAAPTVDEWSLIVLTYSFAEGNMIETLYLNTEIIAQNTGTTPITETAGTGYTFKIGGGGIWDTTGNYFNGTIDEVAVFGSALSADQITYLYSLGKYGPGAAPEITTQPVGAEIYSNDGAYTLSVVSGGTPPFTVEWYKDGILTAYTGLSVAIPRTEANAGSWVAKVSNAYGSAESAAAVISYYKPTSDYEALIASLNPWAYWRLGEAQTEDVNAVAREYGHGKNAPYTLNNVRGLEGAIANDPDTAVSFTGAVEGTAEFSTIVAPDIGMGEVTEATFLVWVKRDGDQTPFTPLVFNRAAAGVSKTSGLNIRENNMLGYHWNDASTSYGFVTDLTLEDGVWNFAALVVTSEAATFYLGDSEGTLSTAANAIAHPASNIGATFTIGGQVTTGSDRQFKGLLDEPAVFNYALSAAEIEKIYALGHGTPVPPTGPEIALTQIEGQWYMTWDAELGAVLQYATSADATEWTDLPEASPEGEAIIREGADTLYYRLSVTK